MKKTAFILLLLQPAFNNCQASRSTITNELIAPYMLPDGEMKDVADAIFKNELFDAYWEDPEHVKELFEEAGFKPLQKDCRITLHPTLPDVVFKLARTKLKPYENPSNTCSVIERVIRAHKFRTIIKELGLKHIVIPQKYLYHPPFLDDELIDKNFVCIAEKFNVLPWEESKKNLWSVQKEVVEEVIALIRAVGFLDIHPHNLCVLPGTDTVAYIDTELLIPWYSPEACVADFAQYVGEKEPFDKTLASIEAFSKYINPESLPQWLRNLSAKQ